MQSRAATGRNRSKRPKRLSIDPDVSAQQTPDVDMSASLADIRRAVTNDIYDIYMLNCASFVEAWSVMALGMWQERGDTLDVWYSHDGRLAAYYLGQDVLDEVHIMQIAVAPEFRLSGLGRRLMQYEIERKRAAGMASMHLEVRASNRAAQKLYTSLGFETVGRRNAYYAAFDNHPAEDAILMSFNL